MMVTETDGRSMIRVIVCRPGEVAEVIEIEDTLDAMEEIIGDETEEYMPFLSDRYDPEQEDSIEEVSLVCDRYAEQKNLEFNRAIRGNRGQIHSVIRGPFIFCYSPLDIGENLTMPSIIEEELLKQYQQPERFVTRNGVNRVEKYAPGQIGDLRDLER